MKRLFLIACVLFVPSLAHAQLVHDPVAFDFTPSPDHFAKNADGTDEVASYEVQAIGMAGSGALIITKNIGKPVPMPDNGKIAVTSLSSFAAWTKGTTYTLTVSAIPTKAGVKAGVSLPSNPFVFDVPAPVMHDPRAPSEIRVR